MKSQVECDFSTSPPANIIHHDKEKTMNIHGHDAPNSYVIDVDYNVPLSTLTSFIDMADACSQHLITGCYHSSQRDWSRKGRSGVATTKFWPGGDPLTGGCACGTTGSCATKGGKFLKDKYMYKIYLNITDQR